MQFSRVIGQLANANHRAAELDDGEMHDVFAAIFDGGIPDLELGATLVALEGVPNSVSSLVGGYRAMARRLLHLLKPDSAYRPLVFPSYGNQRLVPNLLPWLAIVLRRLGIPVLVHGCLDSVDRADSAYVFRELGIMPSATLGEVQQALRNEALAFAPIGVLSPALANLFALQSRLGVNCGARDLALLVDPFRGIGVPVIGLGDDRLRETMEAVCQHEVLDALVFDAADSDAIVDPFLRPRIVAYQGGEYSLLFDAENRSQVRRVDFPAPTDVLGIANWIRFALAGKVPVPHPLVNQLACCLFVSGYALDIGQAKAIAAMQSGSISPGVATT